MKNCWNNGSNITSHERGLKRDIKNYLRKNVGRQTFKSSFFEANKLIFFISAHLANISICTPATATPISSETLSSPRLRIGSAVIKIYFWFSFEFLKYRSEVNGVALILIGPLIGSTVRYSALRFQLFSLSASKFSIRPPPKIAKRPHQKSPVQENARQAFHRLQR